MWNPSRKRYLESLTMCIGFAAVLLVFNGVAIERAAAQVNLQNQARAAKQSASDLIDYDTLLAVHPASSLLTRTVRGLSIQIHTYGLKPNHVYTIWWVIFNEPSACATRPCNGADLDRAAVRPSILWATGSVADRWGQATFVAHLAPGLTEAEGEVAFGPGLLNPRGAEVHLIVRHHNTVRANGSTLLDQLTTMDAGCVGGCIDVQFAIHQP